MSDESKKPINVKDVLKEFCSYIESKVESGEGGDLPDFLPELQKLRDGIEEIERFAEEYPMVFSMMLTILETLSSHNSKLELLKDALVASGVIQVVEADSEEEAKEKLVKDLNDKAISELLKNMDKNTVH